jgi:hypothetical protein
MWKIFLQGHILSMAGNALRTIELSPKPWKQWWIDHGTTKVNKGTAILFLCNSSSYCSLTCKILHVSVLLKPLYLSSIWHLQIQFNWWYLSQQRASQHQYLVQKSPTNHDNACILKDHIDHWGVATRTKAWSNVDNFLFRNYQEMSLQFQ